MVKRLAKWDVIFYLTYKWESYASVFPKNKLIMSKKYTHGIERNNCRNRHWFGRFKRKSIIVSKSKEMVDLTMALFARFIVNENVKEILYRCNIT
jgi:IS1 family transposase